MISFYNKAILKENSITLYRQNVGNRGCVGGYEVRSEGVGYSKGVMTIGVKKRISNVLENYVSLIRERNRRRKKSINKGLMFLTFTLPSKQVDSDEKIKRECWNWFLISALRSNWFKSYVWRSEVQKNGNIHFHLLAYGEVSFTELLGVWNRVIGKLGYIDRYRERMEELGLGGYIKEGIKNKWGSVEKLRERYNRGKVEGWNNPNSVDIKKVKGNGGIIGYIVKYMGKLGGVAGRNIGGRIWGCSDNIKEVKGCTIDVREVENMELIGLRECRGVRCEIREWVVVLYGEYDIIRRDNWEITAHWDSWFNENIEMVV